MDIKTEEAYRLSFQHIQSHDVLAACRTVANYELSQPRPRGLFSGISAQEYWARYPEPSDVEILESIFSETAEILSKISDDDLNAARIIAAFNFIWGLSQIPKWLYRHEFASTPLDDSAVPAMLLFHAQSRQELKEYEEVELSCCPDGCEFCKSEDGKIYKSSDAPVLPHAHCTHEQGCRCCYLPVI
ncbi:hypothetical protein ACTFHU_04645 [Neisseria meningitidis]|uniref:hypothetical protein n=1 Tax=Neisseria meningitidis TaxID=487 RepID=UPI000C34C3C3|nr:hypothetical protein [Neisseria meningitidis]MBG8582108.1 hypothetical protein [Neisseria meningitidis]MBG8668264.1 hypothetical protein [Neisseria meningitidis]MBJ1828185.1 hypothetical protein [Neisseria meningitidis]MBJ7878785.1 hypothetical protein [Neisseria meningitidis]RQL15029.1 hypothetical protein COH36_05050 [Neisseria meningitidis]